MTTKTSTRATDRSRRPGQARRSGRSGRTPVSFFFDPVCPWTWITSRWVIEVSEARDLDITWVPFSLRYHHRVEVQRAEAQRAEAQQHTDGAAAKRLDDQHRGMRVIAAARQQHGNAAVGDLYTALGTSIHHDHDDHLERLDAAIAAARLPATLIGAADDPSWDRAVEVSTDAAKELVGDDVGVPIIYVPGSASTFFGPVMSPAPTGDDALRLWDAFVALSRVRGVYEIKRSRNVGPQFGPRPEPVALAHA